MSEGLKILLTALATIGSGTVVFVLGQLLVKFVVEPIHSLWKLRGEIADSLIFYANIYLNLGYGPREPADEASKLFRQQACQLMARSHLIPNYKILERVRLVPRRQALESAHRELIGLSNSTYVPDGAVAGAMDRLIEVNRVRRDKIVKFLDLRIEPS